MTDLTDEDRAAIAAIYYNSVGARRREIHAAYVAGLAAGRARAIEDCAKVCEDFSQIIGEDCASCAAALRALNAPAAQGEVK